MEHLPENIGFPLFPLQHVKNTIKIIMNTITQNASIGVHCCNNIFCMNEKIYAPFAHFLFINIFVKQFRC